VSQHFFEKLENDSQNKPLVAEASLNIELFLLLTSLYLHQCLDLGLNR
jgi:hypothetical protein